MREASPCVLETERLTLRQPTLADVKAIARLANDRRIAENTRRLPHPYSQDHAVEFVRAIAGDGSETAFLIEHNFVPIGMVGINWREPDVPELGYWLGVEHWGQGFGTEAARAAIDYLLRGIRRTSMLYRGRPRRQSDVAQHPGEMRLPVDRRRAAPLRGAGLVEPGRLLPPLAQRLVVAEELGEFDATGAVAVTTNGSRECAPDDRRSREQLEPSAHGLRRRCGPGLMTGDVYAGGLTAVSSRPSLRSRRKM